MEAKTFIFNTQWLNHIEGCSAKVFREIVMAAGVYAASGEVVDMSPMARMAFSFIKDEMDYNRQRYEATVEKRREAGRKGGKNSAAQAKQAKASKAKQTEAINDNENDNDNDNENENTSYSTTTTTTSSSSSAGRDEDAEILEFDEVSEPPSARMAHRRMSEQLFADSEGVASFCRANGITEFEMRRLADEVINEWNLTGQSHKSRVDSRKHLLAQIRIKIKQNQSKNHTQYATTTTQSAAERQAEFARHIAEKLARAHEPEPDISDLL